VSAKKKIDLRNLDFGNAGAWPNGLKFAACGLIALVILVVIYYFMIGDKRDTLTNLQQTEISLKATYSEKHGRAANLEALKIQLAQMKEILEQMMRQLPGKTEMPDLIVDVSQTALASGIVNELFQPGPETPKEFYAEKPINLRMVGTYHQFGSFMSGVASLPRVVILTMHNISLKPTNKGNKIGVDSNLTLEGTVKTYRYLDEAEQEAQQPATTAAKSPTPTPAPATPPPGGH
jgi:type IV pilus assembly protein PilO